MSNLDETDTMDPYAVNIRKHAHCSRERNDIHDTMIHEVALMAERAGYPMDHECRYVCRPAGHNGEPGYKPDAIWVRIPIPQVITSEAGDNPVYNRDIQLTDEVQEYLLEGKVGTTPDQNLYNSATANSQGVLAERRASSGGRSR